MTTSPITMILLMDSDTFIAPRPVLELLLLYSLAITTTVNLAILGDLILVGFTLMIHYGMVTNAFLAIVAVIEPVSHGFSINCLSVRKSTWKCEFVKISQKVMKLLQWSKCNFLYNKLILYIYS